MNARCDTASQAQMTSSTTHDLTQKLAEIERDHLVLEGWVWTVWQPDLPTLCGMDERDVAALLERGLSTWPHATALLCSAIARTPDAAVGLFPAVLRIAYPHRSERFYPGSGALREIAEAALPRSRAAMRQVGLECFPSAEASALERPTQGSGWPVDLDFPPIETVEGRHARLRAVGLTVADPPGVWGVSSEAALVRFGLAMNLRRLGVWNDETSEELDLLAHGHLR